MLNAEGASLEEALTCKSQCEKNLTDGERCLFVDLRLLSLIAAQVAESSVSIRMLSVCRNICVYSFSFCRKLY